MNWTDRHSLLMMYICSPSTWDQLTHMVHAMTRCSLVQQLLLLLLLLRLLVVMLSWRNVTLWLMLIASLRCFLKWLLYLFLISCILSLWSTAAMTRAVWMRRQTESIAVLLMWLCGGFKKLDVRMMSWCHDSAEHVLVLHGVCFLKQWSSGGCCLQSWRSIIVLWRQSASACS